MLKLSCGGPGAVRDLFDQRESPGFNSPWVHRPKLSTEKLDKYLVFCYTIITLIKEIY